MSFAIGSTRPAILLLILLMALARGAEAHQRLVSTEPARDAAADTVPRELRLGFAEPVELAFTQLDLIGPTGAAVALGPPRLASDSPNVLVVPIVAPLRPGAYIVRWSTASRDGHPVRGEYGFSVAADAVGLEAAPDASEPGGRQEGSPAAVGHQHETGAHAAPVTGLAGGFDAESPGYVAVRWLTYVTLMAVIGAVAFALLVLGYLRRRDLPADRELIVTSRRRAALLGLGFVGVLALVTVARLYAQSLAMHGPDHALDLERIRVMLGRTVWGWGWSVQAGATVAAGAGFALARRGTALGWPLAAVAALALAVTPALSGHAATMTGAIGTLAILADALHVLAAGGWLGGLLVLLLAGLPAAMRAAPGTRGAAVASLVRAFSPTALMFAALLVLTGVFAAIVHSTSLPALFGSRYGTVLFIKLGIFVLVFATGAYNYLRVQPALGDEAGTARLKRSAGVELAVGAAVLLVTAVLVATARPHEETGDHAAATQAAPQSSTPGWR